MKFCYEKNWLGGDRVEDSSLCSLQSQECSIQGLRVSTLGVLLSYRVSSGLSGWFPYLSNTGLVDFNKT